MPLIIEVPLELHTKRKMREALTQCVRKTLGKKYSVYALSQIRNKDTTVLIVATTKMLCEQRNVRISPTAYVHRMVGDRTEGLLTLHFYGYLRKVKLG